MPPDAPPTASCAGPDPRNGLSLARNGCASRRLHSGVNVPGLLLQIPARFPPARSALRLRCPNRFAPVPAASSPQTRCRRSAHRYPPCRPPPLPIGTFTSLRIKAFSGRPASRPADRIRPITSRSPPPSFFNFGCGSSFLARYVSVGLLFLKPLGTFFTMLPDRFFVK